MTLTDQFDRLKKAGEAALVVYVTAGDPSIDQLPAILEALVEGGADVIELGVPFSDPIADGPTIQASSQRALEHGVTPPQVLDSLAMANIDVPLVLMGYYNTILRATLPGFALAAKAAGVVATIVCDIIPEEAADWVKAGREVGLDTVFLAAPTSTMARIEAVAKGSSGFVYAVSRTGVTGAASVEMDDVRALVASIRTFTNLPVCVGFGIREPEQVRAMASVADGVIVGSSLVALVAEKWNGGAGRSEIVAYVRSLKEATRRR